MSFWTWFQLPAQIATGIVLAHIVERIIARAF